jgi:site-specific DNA-methyltransferase (adenine-specific)
MVVAIEDAGFEVRDMISWISNKTFPKSHNVSLSIDKHLGHSNRGKAIPVASSYQASDVDQKNKLVSNPVDDYAAKTDEAEKWVGWGTALKPTVEPVVLARKPLIGTVAENVLAWGVGGLNIDASRIGTNPGYKYRADANDTTFHGQQGHRIQQTAEKAGKEFIESTLGRWPANVIFDEDTAGLLDEQSGFSKSTGIINRWKDGAKPFGGGAGHEFESVQGVADSGGASRFFYVAKASKRDRNEGLEELPETKSGSYNGNAIQPDGNKIGANPDRPNQPAQNFHPTVKPTNLMRYLIKLVTPAGGIVLDPFTGSGSTGKAALLDGYQFVGIELTADYLPIIEGRLRWADQEHRDQVEAMEAEEKETLF